VLVIDTHFHFYPNFSFEACLDACLTNVKKLGIEKKDLQIMLCFTERYDCNFFEKMEYPQLKQISDNLKTLHYKQVPFYFLRGYQIISTENIEVLALGCPERLPDKIFNAAELCHKIQQANAVAVLPWGLGKWLGKRGKIIQSVLDENKNVCVGTTALQPIVFRNMFIKKFTGHVVLFGSDALPMTGEEKYCCSMVVTKQNVPIIDEIILKRSFLTQGALLGTKTSFMETLTRESLRRIK